MHPAPRSLLFVPAANERALAKARTLDQDATLIDLEDAVGEAERPAARANLAAWLAARPEGKLAVVRVSTAQGEEGRADIRLAAAAGANAILLPKLSDPDTVLRARDALGGADVRIWAMVETARGVLAAPAIAAAIAEAGGGALVIGPNDLRREAGMAEAGSRARMLPWLMAVLLAARAYGLHAFDGVYNAFRDTDGFAAEVGEARAMGFDGKTLIHPAQIAPTHAAYAPTPEELDWARRVVDAFSAEGDAGRAVLSVDGRMVERMHLAQARRLLATT